LLEEARQAAHAAGLPFSERPYDGQELDPYSYDGSMTPEDYELWQQRIAQERSAKMNDPLSIQIHNRQRFEQNEPGEWLKLPATAEQLQEALRRVGITAENPQDFFINGIDSPIEAVARLSLENIQTAGVDELNYLAARLEQFDPAQIEKLNVNGDILSYWNDVHHLTEYVQNTEYFMYIPGITDHKALGDYYLNKSGLVQMPEGWKAAVDIEKLGQLTAEQEKGILWDNGYIFETGDEWQPVTEIPQEYRIMSFPQPELTAEEAAARADGRDAALRDIGEAQLEPPTPVDIGGYPDDPIEYDAISTRAPAVATAKPPVRSVDPQPVKPIALESEKPADKLKEITDRLEQGIAGIFESEQYADYLKTLSKFHNYSLNNTILIAMQKPDASLIAGFNTWKNEHGRNVRKGEKGIKIIAPSPFKIKKEMKKIDPDTQRPVIGRDGKPVTEQVEIKIPAFKVVSVFDVSQTEGKELPTIGVDELTGNVKQYRDFFAALEKASPVPVALENIEGNANGYYHQVDKRIAIREDMSELQTLKTAIHEIAHARLHDVDMNKEQDEQPRADRRTREVEAESIAYTVCQHYGLDTSDYSFGYVAGWSSGKELAELKASLETIRATAAELITEIDGHFAELQQARDAEQRPVFESLPPEQQQALSDTVKDTLQFFVENDLKEHGELSDGTLEAIAVQGYAYRDGSLEKLVEPQTTAPEQERQQGDTYAIYQLKQDDSTRDFRFEPYDRLQAAGLSVDPANYVFVYSGQLGKDETLDAIFERFNINRPSDFTGHSLSISDIVTLNRDGVETVHYIDSGAGYKEVPEFLQPAPAFDMQQTTNRLQELHDNVMNANPDKTSGTAAYNMAIKRLDRLNNQIPENQPQLKAVVEYAAGSTDLSMLKGRMTAAMQEISHIRTAEMSTEQNYNMIDGVPNNTPSVGELEARAKAGEQINLSDLAAAIKADKAAAIHDTGKKPSIREQLKQAGADPSYRDKSAPSRTRDKSPGLEV
jgi:antirestriction protein ArdC